MLHRILAVLGLALAAWLPGAATAGPVPQDVARLHLLGGWTARDGRRIAAIEISLADGWKTYWRAPGEAGIPPVFDWSGSRNLRAVRVLWPMPQVFLSGGMQAVGYTGDVILPIEIEPEDPALPVDLSARVSMGVCHEVCMPIEAQIKGTLSPGQEGKERARIIAAMDQVPQPVDVPTRCQVEPIADGVRVTARMQLPPLGAEEHVVIEGPSPEIWVSAAEVRREGGTLEATADLVPPQAAPFALDPGALTITVLGEGRAVEISGCSGR